MIAPGRDQRGNRFSGETGSGLTFRPLFKGAAGTLNGSSPTANLVGVNIKGNEVLLHFPQAEFMAMPSQATPFKEK